MPSSPRSAAATTCPQLEWRALAQALRATDDAPRRCAAADALAFRAARRAAYPGSAAGEDALELHEGLAEYTGVVVGRPGDRTGAALHDLGAHVEDPSFVRSFAYATGPAYELLLDRCCTGVGARRSAGLARCRTPSQRRSVARRPMP